MDLLPKVFRTEGNIAEFDPTKIFESILKETGMNEIDAKRITELVVRRIISSGIKFLSGPHIREIVCSILSEEHYENERKLYTRIGMPLMDYEEILEKGPIDKPNEQINPEKIHHWAADKISEEYAHLRILNNEESKAHLYGDIHINGLHYFDSRPFSQLWDFRFILKNGLPPIGSLKKYNDQKPAKNLVKALDHLSKWLAMTQSEFYGNQGFNFITTFLAPYAHNLSEEIIMENLREFIYDINQVPLIIGRNVAKTSIFSSCSIFEALSELSAINPGGKTENLYGDFQDTNKKLLKALIIVLKEFYDEKSFQIPSHQLILNKELLEEIDNLIPTFWDQYAMMSSSYFINLYLDIYKDRFVKQFSKNKQLHFGILQNISLNLPRYAYLSRNEDEFVEILITKLNLCSSILLKKYNIIKKRLNSNHLPLCGTVTDGEPLYKLEKQNLSISLVGLNEAIKYLTNYELHEHSEAIIQSKKILKIINKICSELSNRENKKYILTENLSEKAIHRFTKLDLKHFPLKVKIFTNNKNHMYTNSVHYRTGIEVDLLNMLKNQGEFHRFIQYGAVEYINLNKINLPPKDLIKSLCKNSNLSCIKFYS